MNQIDIETFLMLVRTKNITKTAENLYVSQPTVSHRLKLLEEELNVKLLIRKKGHKRVELTAKGEAFIPIAERWLSLMSETMTLQNSDDVLHLNIGCTNTLNSTLFRELYRRINRDANFHFSMNISTHYSNELYENLENYMVDVGFVYHHLHFKNIISEPILKEKMYLVQQANGAIKKEKIFVNELDPHNEICFIWETNYHIWHEQMISRGNRPYLEVDIYELLKEFMTEPGMWTIAPKSVVDELAKTHDIYVSQIADRKQPPERITYMITHKDMTESKAGAVAAFREKLLDYFKERGLLETV